MTIIISGGITGNTDAQHISYSGKNISLTDFFSVISSQTGCTVFYSNEVISQSHPVELNLQNVSLQQVLNEALKNQSLTYTIRGNAIFISVIQSGKKISDASQEHIGSVHGNITDNSNHSIPGASVSVKSGSGTVMTDDDGNFTIPVKKGDSILIITSSAVGVVIQSRAPENGVLTTQTTGPTTPIFCTYVTFNKRHSTVGMCFE